MQAMPIRNFIILFILFLIYPFSSIAATQQRTALVIGNSAYISGHLKNPVNDATDMATALKKTGFSVTLKKNANLREMLEAIEDFGNTLKRGGTGLFYYAGHGVQVGSANYLLPIGTRVNKEGDVRYEAVDVGRILTEMEAANNGLNIVILDACRDNPFGNTFRSSSRGLSIVTHAPTGTFISYSTGAGQVARDGEGRNSPYTKALLENITKPGLTINKVFMNVRSRVLKSTGQVPWELSSLVGDFYFVPLKASAASVRDKATPASQTANDLDEENQRLETEQRRLKAEKAAFEKQKALTEKRRQIEKERERLEAEKEAQRQAELERKKAKRKGTTTLAMGTRPSKFRVNEIRRDGRFIAYNNGTVVDTRTNLMWASKDNGSGVTWEQAKSYCENFRGGGYTDWRMPTKDELEGLYDYSIERGAECHELIRITELLNLTCRWVWAKEMRLGEAAYVDFADGYKNWIHVSYYGGRVLPVRTNK